MGSLPDRIHPAPPDAVVRPDVHGAPLDPATEVAELAAELSRERACQELRIAERVRHLNGIISELRAQVASLTRRNHEIALFGRMNEFLQVCTTEAEAYSIISDTLALLFPRDSGAIFALNASRDMLEVAVTWGARPPGNLVFSPEECWAHRRGQLHTDIATERRCPHVAGDDRHYACIPLVAHGEPLGILHILDGKEPADDSAGMQELLDLTRVFADNIGHGIGHLKLRDTLRSLAIRDPLTGLFNRRYMEEAMTQEEHRARRNAAQLAAIVVDVDHFKQFNDRFGHDGGDAVLRALGSFFRRQVRGGDIVCRYGGEEFIFILSPTTPTGARERAEKIRADVSLMTLRHANRPLGGITLSMGIAIFPDHAANSEALIKAADIALYKAKRRGRNRVAMFSARSGQRDTQS